MLEYCRRCIMPNTRPHLRFDDAGVCSACRNHEARAAIDWTAREAELRQVLDRFRSKEGYYDCIIPVSGGKDSTFQVLKMLEYGMTPLCVTGVTDDLTPIGRRNLENLRELGVDLFEVAVNPVVRRKMNRIALQQVGDISWPEHVAIFSFPVWIALRMNIPLIVWGENPQKEYGGPASEEEKSTLDANWLQEYGGLLGLRPSDFVGQEGIRPADLILYNYPSQAQIDQVGVTGLYLGYYLPWSGLRNALLAQAHGFETYPTAIENQLVNYENLDNFQTGIHDYFAYLKYGFGRAAHQACILIRHGILERQEAVALVKKRDGLYPATYLGRSIEEILAPIGLDRPAFDKICDAFTNKRIFRTNNTGTLVRDPTGNLIKRSEVEIQ